MNLTAMVDEIGRAVSASVARGLAPISRQVEELMQWRKSVGEIRNGVDGKDGANGLKGEIGPAGKDGTHGKDGAPGQNAPPVDLAAIVAKVLPLVPPSKDGRDGRDGADGIHGKDGAPGQVGEKGEPGIDGKEGPHGRDGIDGKDGAPGLMGKDGRPGVGIKHFSKDEAANKLEIFLDDDSEPYTLTLPAPQRGEKGEPGISGKDGRDGIDGKDGGIGLAGKDGNGIRKFAHDEKAHTLDIVMDDGEVFALRLPVPERGEKGEPGLAGKNGADGINGKDGASGRDGKDGAPGVRGEKGDPPSEDEIARLVAKTVDATLPGLISKGIESVMDGIITRASLLVPPGRDGLPGRPGTPGEDGKDGNGIDSIRLEQTDKRAHTLTVKATDGTTTNLSLRLDGFVLDAGVHRPGSFYEKGDGVTFGGSYWIALKDTKASPRGSDDWRLAVKAGRDGKDAE